jgi:hypothetical protein
MPQRLAAAQSCPNSDLVLDAEHTLVDSYIDRWIDHWCPPDLNETRQWLFRYEVSGVRLLLHLEILKFQDPDADLSRHHHEILRIAEFIFEDALSHDHIPYFAFKSGYVLFAAEIILRLGKRPDLVLRMALRMAGDPDRPPISTSTRYNGYQMLSMMS